MSTTSKLRSTKRKNQQCRNGQRPKPYLHPIREKLFGIFKPDNEKIEGAFGRQDGKPALPPKKDR